MQNYIENVKYIEVKLKKEDILEIPVPKYMRLKHDPEHPSYIDS